MKKFILYFSLLFMVSACHENLVEETDLFNEKIKYESEYQHLFEYLKLEKGYSESEIKYDKEKEKFIVKDMAFPVKSLKKEYQYFEDSKFLKHRATECDWPPISEEAFNEGRRQSEKYEILVWIAIQPNWPQHWLDAIEDGVDQWNSLENATVRFNLAPYGTIHFLGDGVRITYQHNISQSQIAIADVGAFGDIGHDIQINADHQDFDNSNWPPQFDRILTIVHELGHTIGYRHTDESLGCYVRKYMGRSEGWYNSPTSGGVMDDLVGFTAIYSWQHQFTEDDIKVHDIVYKWNPVCYRSYSSTGPCTWIDPELIVFD